MMIPERRELADRLRRSLLAAGAFPRDDSFFSEIAGRYDEAHRHYHDLSHIEACLSSLDRFARQAKRRAEVELALWLHDVVYDPRRSDNEQRSAALARDRLRGLGVRSPGLNRITRYIEGTRDHDVSSGDGALTNDMDLAILAASPEAFARFEVQIRAEYAHVPAALYRPGRRRVLERFQARPVLYRVPAVRSALETTARENLARRIGQLAEAEADADAEAAEAAEAPRGESRTRRRVG